MSKKTATLPAKSTKPESDTIPYTDKQQQAIQLDYKIKTTCQLIGTALVDFCQQLKEMRDSNLFTELGYESFEAYTEKEIGIKYRQAFNYIKAYEKLDPAVIASGLGIKKLELLTTVPDLERDEFMENNDVEGMTTAEMQEKIKELMGLNEQLSLQIGEQAKAETNGEAPAEVESLTEQLRDAQEAAAAAEAARLAAEDARAEAEAELESMKDTPIEAVDTESLKEKAMAQARAEAEKEKKQAIKEATEAARKKAEAENEKKLASARDEARKAALEEAEKQKAEELARIEAEKTAAAERAAELEKQLGLASSTETTAFAIHYEQFSGAFDKMLEQIAQLKGKNMAEQADKLTGALRQSLEKLGGILEENTK